MAAHKVPQDVEAEDKFLGPLSFKQFLFFGGALVCVFIMYQLAISPVPFLIALILPFFIICVALAFPWTPDQPTELWLASRIRFILVPRRRVWNQDGVKELVVITAPKRDEHIYTDGLSQVEVRSRLSALANVVDSRGWAVRDPQGVSGQVVSDRLVSGARPLVDPLKALDAADPLDDHSSTVAQNFTQMIEQSEMKRKQQTRNLVDQALHGSQPQSTQQQTTATSGSWFTQQPQQDDGIARLRPQAGQGSTMSREEQQFLDRVHAQEEEDARVGRTDHMKVIQPLGQDAPQDTTQTSQPQTTTTNDDVQNAQATSPAGVDPAIMTLAQNDDLNVETIARQAKRVIDMNADDEVVISLHGN